MSYRIREVDPSDEEIADILSTLHTLTFFDSAPLPDFQAGHAWVGYLEALPVSFAFLRPSDRYPRAGYFSRVGVIPSHRGHGLQRRHMRALENRAKRNGWNQIVSDTTDNAPSANNLILAGYRLFDPAHPWSFPQSIYWMKKL